MLKQTEKLRREAIRYLGYKDERSISSSVNLFIQNGIAEICKIAEPRIVHQYFSLDSTANFAFPGKDVENLLTQCDGVIFMAATLGISVDRSLNRAQIQNMTYALVLDSCATAAIESVCDDWQDALAVTYLAENRYLTHRYSPGYGDLPLSTQPQFLSLVNAEKIGLMATQNFLLTPSKSVTAIIGVGRFQQRTTRTCNICNMYSLCYFRQRGLNCAK